MEEEEAKLAPELQSLSNLLESSPENFVSGNEKIRIAALAAAKFVFDHALATEPVSSPHIEKLRACLSSWEAPQTRSQTRARTGKRKRSASPPPARKLRKLELTPLSSLFIDGTDEDQIWGQLDLRAKVVCGVLEDALGEPKQGNDDLDSDAEMQKMLQALESLERNGMSLEDIISAEDDESLIGREAWLDQCSDDEDGESPDDDEDDEGGSDYDETEGDLGSDENVTDSQDSVSSSEEEVGDAYFPDSDVDLGISTSNGTLSSVLDDDFFKLHTFNAESEAAEAKHVSTGSLGRNSDSDYSEDDDDASFDMFAPVDDLEQSSGDESERNDREACYKDFFDPPQGSQRKRQNGEPSSKVRFKEEVKIKKIKLGKKRKQPSTEDLLQPYDDDLVPGSVDGPDELAKDNSSAGDFIINGQEAIARMKDDLFVDHDESENDHLSSHQKRMAALSQEITRLEAENVGEKDWVLMGEASSRSRPQNSLLAEDLEFDRVMKAAPEITEENVQALEDKIKARIVDGRFDDVIRKRPLDDKPFLPSRVIELNDTKSTQSLAQIYEADYVAAQSGESGVDDRDGRLLKEHQELESLWENICWKLDALCNAHFVPKQPKSAITTVSNAPAMSLESALPTAKSLSTMLAPEEIFAPNLSDLRTKSEMTPTQKRALRNKERKSRKKTRDILDKSVDKFTKMNARGVKKGKEAVKTVLKTGKGVTVLGKKGSVPK